MKARWLGVMLVSLALQVPPSAQGAPAWAGQSGCILVGLQAANATCAWSYVEYNEASSSGDGHTWVVTLQPNNGGIQRDDLLCDEAGESGLWHDVYMDGVDVGDVCVPDDETPDVTIAEIASDDFETYAWPKSKVTIQPPRGKTLVNLETIFYTDNAAPRAHVIQVGGRTVTIEATPVSYVWTHGDGSNQSTSSPGHAYPNHDVFHVYESVDKVDVQVDTVYGNGRFRIGSGEWRAIPGSPTVTVVGPTVTLEILEAKPQLVIR